MEIRRNYGTTDRASRLKAQSLSIPFYTLYTFYTLLYSLYFLYSLYPSILSILTAHSSQLMTRSSAKHKLSTSVTHSIFLKSSNASEWDMVSISNILVKKVSYLRRASFRVFALLFRIRFLYSLTILAYSSIATSSLSMSLSSRLPS